MKVKDMSELQEKKDKRKNNIETIIRLIVILVCGFFIYKIFVGNNSSTVSNNLPSAEKVFNSIKNIKIKSINEVRKNSRDTYLISFTPKFSHEVVKSIDVNGEQSSYKNKWIKSGKIYFYQDDNWYYAPSREGALKVGLEDTQDEIQSIFKTILDKNVADKFDIDKDEDGDYLLSYTGDDEDIVSTVSEIPNKVNSVSIKIKVDSLNNELKQCIEKINYVDNSSTIYPTYIKFYDINNVDKDTPLPDDVKTAKDSSNQVDKNLNPYS